MEQVPGSEITRRLSRFQDALDLAGVDAALIMQAADLYYFSGTAQHCYLFIPRRGDPVLMVKRSYGEAIKASPLNHIVLLPGLKEIPQLLSQSGYSMKDVDTIGLEMDILPTITYLYLRDKVLIDKKLINIAGILRNIRAVKSTYELTFIGQAVTQVDKIFALVPRIIKSGVSEVEVCAYLEYHLRCIGHQGVLRVRGLNSEIPFGQVLSGANGAVASYFDGSTGGPGMSYAYPFGPSLKKVYKNEVVIIDFVGVINGYMADMTRTFSLGNPGGTLSRAHAIALTIQEEIAKLLRPGVPCATLYRAALDIAERNGLTQHFMGFQERAQFVGHGIGLELNELPVISASSRDVLEEGMVVAIEPKFIFPEGAVGIENIYVVASSGGQRFSTFDDELIVVDS